MASILIVYATTEGQTRKVAIRVAEHATEYGHTATVVDAAAGTARFPGTRFDAVVVAASVHHRHHQAAAARWVRGNRRLLERLPSVFFSVSLSAAGDERQRMEARRYAKAFLRDTGWRPSMARMVAGALAYTRYGRLVRWKMRLVAWRLGADIDTSSDHEYTDWEQLRHDVDRFLASAVPEPALELVGR